MKKLTLFSLVIICLSMVSNVYGAEPVIKISTGEWAPFISIKLKNYGFVTHIVSEAFAIEGVKVDYKFCPWPRAMNFTKMGVTHASSAWYWNEERSKDFIFSEPLFIEQQVFFHLKSEPFDWKQISDLKGKRIGGMIGYFYGEEFKKAEDSKLIQIERISSDELNFKKLLAGRIHIVVTSLFVGTDLLRNKFSKEQMSKITYHPKSANDGPLHLIFGKNAKGQEWRAIFNRGLGKLKSNGQLDQIYNRALKGTYNK